MVVWVCWGGVWLKIPFKPHSKLTELSEGYCDSRNCAFDTLLATIWLLREDTRQACPVLSHIATGPPCRPIKLAGTGQTPISPHKQTHGNTHKHTHINQPKTKPHEPTKQKLTLIRLSHVSVICQIVEWAKRTKGWERRGNTEFGFLWGVTDSQVCNARRKELRERCNRMMWAQPTNQPTDWPTNRPKKEARSCTHRSSVCIRAKFSLETGARPPRQGQCLVVTNRILSFPGSRVSRYFYRNPSRLAIYRSVSGMPTSIRMITGWSACQPFPTCDIFGICQKTKSRSSRLWR